MTRKIAQAIKDYLVDLAVNDKLPLDMTQLEMIDLEDVVSKAISDYKSSDESIFDELGYYICDDYENYPAIVTALKKALTETPTTLIDHIEYDVDGEPETITVWQKVEYAFNVEEFCQLVGIKN
jgi:hypothetical protein